METDLPRKRARGDLEMIGIALERGVDSKGSDSYMGGRKGREYSENRKGNNDFHGREEGKDRAPIRGREGSLMRIGRVKPLVTMAFTRGGKQVERE